MQTTIDLPEQLVSDLIECTGALSPQAAIRRAAEDFVRRQKVEALVRAAGTVEFDQDPAALRKIEIPGS